MYCWWASNKDREKTLQNLSKGLGWPIEMSLAFKCRWNWAYKSANLHTYTNTLTSLNRIFYLLSTQITCKVHQVVLKSCYFDGSFLPFFLLILLGLVFLTQSILINGRQVLLWSHTAITCKQNFLENCPCECPIFLVQQKLSLWRLLKSYYN